MKIVDIWNKIPPPSFKGGGVGGKTTSSFYPSSRSQRSCGEPSGKKNQPRKKQTNYWPRGRQFRFNVGWWGAWDSMPPPTGIKTKLAPVGPIICLLFSRLVNLIPNINNPHRFLYAEKRAHIYLGNTYVISPSSTFQFDLKYCGKQISRRKIE